MALSKQSPYLYIERRGVAALPLRLSGSHGSDAPSLSQPSVPVDPFRPHVPHTAISTPLLHPSLSPDLFCTPGIKTKTFYETQRSARPTCLHETLFQSDYSAYSAG
jgi:hypothetical protein